ncbi:MAG TPA: hypothetical protein VER33_18320, partial [Polyangiaceae bacterium]|nr:hypothetical protein [Polyangiaceae bacterium]
GRLLAKVLDFGLAKFYEPTTADVESVRLTREGALFGTPAYMSPEQAKGQGEVDHRADLWALGCIVYECLTGQTVWNVEQGVAMILAQIASSPLPRPSKLRPDLPPSFDQWFERALHRDANRRYQTARELADSLADALYPKEGAAPRPTPSLHSATEAAVLDEIFGDARSQLPVLTLEPNLNIERAQPRPASTPTQQPAELVPLPDTSAAPGRSSSVRAVSVVMVLAALALGAYAAWLYVLHPPGKPEAGAPRSTPAAFAPRTRAGSKPEPIGEMESAVYADKLQKAQELLATDPKRSLEMFRAAFDAGGMPVARSLLSHVAVAVEEAGSCKVTGISRPRPFQIEVAVSRPTIAVTSKGVVVSWVDNHFDARRRQAFTVRLDSAMRRASLPVAVTPEAQNVRQPQLVPVGDQLALVYWEEGGKEPGAFVRLLDAEGKIATPARRLSSARSGDYHPTLVPGPDNELWAVWEEVFESSSSDIVARRLGPDLTPRGEAVRLTALRPPAGPARQPRTPDAAIAHGRLYVTFAKDLGGQRVQVMLQSISLKDPKLLKGLPPPAKPPRGRAARKKGDEFIGSLKPVSTPTSRNALPHLTCPEEGCFIAWDDEKAGALMAFVDKERGPLWHREFATKGARPMLARDDKGTLLAFYEDARLKVAPLAPDGVAKSSVVTRVNGLQPYPDLARGDKPGQWYVAFRDYEAAHLEVFALRVECP